MAGSGYYWGRSRSSDDANGNSAPPVRPKMPGLSQDFQSSEIQTGNGSGGGRGGDVGSHNRVKDSHDVSNTIINYYGPQFIVNSDGQSLDLSMNDKKSVLSYPFHGGTNQQWVLQEDGGGKFALQSKLNGSFVNVGGTGPNAKLVSSDSPYYWRVTDDGTGMKLVAPDTDLALALQGSSAKLSPSTDKSTQLFVVEDTPENRTLIKEKKVQVIYLQKATKPAEKPDQPSGTSGSNLLIVPDVPGALPNPLKGLQNYFSSDGVKNLVICLGNHQAITDSWSPNSYRTLTLNDSPASSTGSPTHGFPTGRFRIRTAGSQQYWTLRSFESHQDGNGIMLWLLEDNSEAQMFFINGSGNLCCVGSDSAGVAVDIIGDCPVITHNRPVTLPWPNPWSHPLPTFSYSRETNAINVEYHVDPLLSATWPRPERAWKGKEYVLSARCSKAIRIPKFDEIAHWAPNSSYSKRWTDRGGEHIWDALGVEESAKASPEDVMWLLESV